MTTMTKSLPSPAIGARNSWQEWIVATSSTSATQLTVKVYYCITSAGAYKSKTTMRYAVDFSYDGGSTWVNAITKTRSGGHLWNRNLHIADYFAAQNLCKNSRNIEDPGGGHPAHIRNN